MEAHPPLEASVCSVVCRRKIERILQLPGPSCVHLAQKQGSDHLGRGTRRIAHLTYQELHRQVSKFANVLKGLGIQKGDRVVIYMPLIPELAISMLACTRIGAVHSVIFGGFSSQALVDRIQDAQAKLVVTADGGFRRGSIVSLKKNVDEAMKRLPFVDNVIVFRRTKEEIHMDPGRDHWWHELMENASDFCEPEVLDSEHPLIHSLHQRHDR